jgi:hypothetical protein
VKIYSFCLMPSHFHFVLEPEHGQLKGVKYAFSF